MAIISNAVTMADAGAFSVGLGSLTLIKTITLGSAAATISFIDGASSVVLDDTYPIYKFEFIGIHPASDNKDFGFNLTIDSGTNFNVQKQSTNFAGFHDEGDGDSGLGYEASLDLANGTGEQVIYHNTSNDADHSAVGELFLYNPSSTTFVKHFIGKSNDPQHSNATANHFIAGYANTTSAVDGIRFKFDSGNIDAGTIKLYGIKDS